MARGLHRWTRRSWLSSNTRYSLQEVGPVTRRWRHCQSLDGWGKERQSPSEVKSGEGHEGQKKTKPNPQKTSTGLSAATGKLWKMCAWIWDLVKKNAEKLKNLVPCLPQSLTVWLAFRNPLRPERKSEAVKTYSWWRSIRLGNI